MEGIQNNNSPNPPLAQPIHGLRGIEQSDVLEKRIQLELAEKVGAEEAEKRALGLLEELDEEERDEDDARPEKSCCL